MQKLVFIKPPRKNTTDEYVYPEKESELNYTKVYHKKSISDERLEALNFDFNCSLGVKLQYYALSETSNENSQNKTVIKKRSISL